MNRTKIIKEYFDSVAPKLESWRERRKFYHRQIESLHKFLIPKKTRVLEIGSGNGDLLAAVSPSYGLGIDISAKMVNLAKKKYKKLKFAQGNAESLKIKSKFDYVILSDLIGNVDDIQGAFKQLEKVSHDKTRVVITYYNFLWEPVLILAEKIGLKLAQPLQNWLSEKDIENLLFLSGFEVVKKGAIILLPIEIPLISTFLNKYVAKLPVIKNLCLVSYFVARRSSDNKKNKDYSVSVVIPARNEFGNIENAVKWTPKMGRSTDIIFVEGGSSDNTLSEIKRVIKKYKGKRKISLVYQGRGIGKGDAVRKGFAKAKGDIFMILDADLTVAPKELPKFYETIKNKKAEFVMGSRLVYQQEDQAMRFLNILGNKFFSLAFSWLLDQQIKDTLCGTKVLFREDYQRIANGRSYFGDFDPFGDYDLIFGAAKLNLKISEIPIRYKARTYGSTNISRFKHGWLLLKMTIYAARKLKFI